MRHWNRIWLLFVIAAVGLVLSWGQVGRKASRALAEHDAAVLATESPCAPLQAPCAAYGEGLALVMGPAGPGGVRVQTVGAPASRLDEALLIQRGPGVSVRTRLAAESLGPGNWRLRTPEPLPDAEALEIRLRLAGPPAAAVFPLR